MSKVTFLTPTFNRASYLPRLYESLCAQTNHAFQWLIIDDGSTDETELVVAQLKEKHILPFDGRKSSLSKTITYGEWIYGCAAFKAVCLPPFSFFR